MKITSMNTPKTRREFERNFNIVSELMKDGKCFFTLDTPETVEGLRKVRYLPNGRIDFLTVEESARSYVNTMVSTQVKFMNNYSDSEE
ncbi:AVAST type 1 anti-phage system protein Avs1c [Lysinibacillus irui]|uniref:AVAST type 1 anti-phage system protein Avs1c n=1 Tax=Lysinibacillus irui TaxID=2998077 RepID=A0ABU5NKM4_9BACI|nr:AVAST type 1 anti-phage system protein Avs1c [Lysinibacillus irui]MEA0554872.1 AVAST type 1 anti-phage system protein Avs1c [Lysinibacillus irui]MEA0976587.1 AVAST type 1 anti-phage system protein Avs1c [Lysinibacillus irui]MEA1042741.1 AVAST type 1 anti-phage system protein Avs1c [Lysinibacillus irui]